MGLDVNGVRFLLYAKSLGVDFSQLAMLGRQSLNLNRRELKQILLDFNCSYSSEVINDLYLSADSYSEPLLHRLGAVSVESFDYSNYENATRVHDMNFPIGEDYKRRYTLVLDGGTLEHIFNVPTALKNAMEMVAVGGHFMSITPANNFVGHGFYQFSPELFFSVFDSNNGFDIVEVIALEHKSEYWYHVKSPKSVRSRVTLENKVPVYLLVIAKKVEEKTIFSVTPQQSDYVETWEQSADSNSSKTAKRKNFSYHKQRLTKLVKRKLKGFGGGFDRKFYEKFKPETTASIDGDFRTTAFS